MVNKVSKSRYKSYGQKQRFSRRGSELTRQIDEIRRQREIEISGLRALADNEQRNDELYIRGLKAKGATELENKQKIHKFERDATSNALGALGVAAEGEIRALQGQAEEAGKQKDFWKDFAVNHSQKYARLAEGAAKLIDEKRSIYLLGKLDPKFAYKAADNFTKATKIVEKNALKEVGADKKKKNQILDPITKKEIIVGSGTSNIHYQNKMVQEVQKGRAFYASVMQRYAKDEFGKSLLTTSMAQDAYISYSYHLLKELNIDPASKAGREITRTFAVWGRDVAEQRWNQHQATKDVGHVQEKAETLATEIREALKITEPTQEQTDAWNNAQITFQGLHHIINGSIYESTDGKFGLRSWNPQTLNAEVIKQVYPYLKEMSYDELYTVFNKFKIFDETTAEKIKVKGQEVGILDKSKTNQEALLDLVIANADFRKKETAAKRDGQLKALILPYDQAWEKAKESGDFTEFNKMIPSYVSLVSSSKFNETDYRTTAWDRTKYNPSEYGSYQTYENMLGLVVDGDLEEAMILIASTAGTGEVPDAYGKLAHKEFRKLHTAINVINNISWDNAKDLGAINEVAKDIYKKSMNAAFKDRTLNVRDQEVIKALRQHIIREIVNDKSEDTPDKVFQRAIETVDKAFDTGIKEQKGVYAATEASVSNWTPATRDTNGKVIKPGGYGKKSKDSIRPDNLNNYVFHGFDERIDSSVTQTAKFFADEFIRANAPEGSTKLTKARLRENIEINLNNANSILTIDEKNLISMQVLGLEEVIDNRAINSNLKILITMAKKYNPKITTKDVMDMVIDGLSANKELYGQLEGKTYPMGLEDITEKLTGKCTKSTKNNFTLCVAELFKKNGVDINEQLQAVDIKADDFLNLYAEPKQ